MVEQDRGDKQGRQGGTDWFIDFEQDDLCAKLMRPQARRRPGQSGTSKPKPDPQPRTTGPSPWVADFLLNQVEGARIEPMVRRPPAQATGERAAKRTAPSQHEKSRNGSTVDRRPLTTAEHVADGRVGAPRPTSRATTLSPPTIGRAEPGVDRVRPNALAVTLVAGLAAGLWAFPQGSWRSLDESDTRSVGTVTIAPRPDGTPEPQKTRRTLPLQTTAILQPTMAIPVLSSPALSPPGYRETIEAASLIGAPPVSLFEPTPASIEAALQPIQVARIVRPLVQTATPIGVAVEVTAQDVDEKQIVAAGPASATNYGSGVQENAGYHPVTPVPEAVSTEVMVPTATTKGLQGKILRHQLHTARRNDTRRHAPRPSSSKVAQAMQSRSFALPAALRPTSF